MSDKTSSIDTLVQTAIEYPVTDGEPMAETDVYRDQMVYLIEALRAYFSDEPQVYVAGNLFIYYEEGDPHSRVAPDTFVVFGVAQKQRRIYKLWEEGPAPQVVIEVSSRGTRREDLWEKRGLYEYLGVAEYFLFDPLAEYLDPPLQGYRLTGEGYRSLEPARTAAGWQLFSEQLKLHLQTEGDFLRLYDPERDEKLLTPLEAQETARRAQARIAELEAELARLRGER